MQDKSEPIFIETNRKGNDNTIKVGKILSTIVTHWSLFVFCIVGSLTVSFFYLRYTTPQYEARAKILIKDEKSGSVGEGQILKELGMQSSGANVENEIEILESRTLMMRVVESLDLNVHYHSTGRIKTSEYYYQDLPFRFKQLTGESSLARKYSYTIRLNGREGFVLSDSKRTWDGVWGDTVLLPIGNVVVQEKFATANPAYDYEEYSIKVLPIEAEAIKVLSRLSIAITKKKSSVIELLVSDPLQNRGEDILNELINVYLKASIDDRNATLTSTIEFIEDRLKGVTFELSGIERDIEQFKRSKKLTDLSEQSKLLLDYSSDYAKQLTNKEVELTIVESLESYLKDENNRDRLVPSALLVQDEAAMTSMQSYNELQLKRSSLLLTSTEDNPFVKNVDVQLGNIREDLMRSLTSMKQGIKVSIEELKSRSGSLDDEIRKVPQNERVFLEYSRQQNIKQELYLFLLTKKEETAISKSSTVANARIIDPAKSDGAPFKPIKKRVYLAAIAIGLFIPSAYLFIKQMLNVKVVDKDDVKQLVGLNIIGEIGRSDNDKSLVIAEANKTVIAEQFRTLRTNLQFLLSSQQSKTVLLTSSMSGEGKSFIATNLAATLALGGAKVVLLELDLRKPKISEEMGIQNKNGFTKYIIGKAEVSGIVHESGVVDNLYVVPAGAIPPNPSELLLSKKVDELFSSLEEEYDYIVVDTAPVGLVTDAQLLSKVANTVLFVSRMNYTYKEQIKDAEELVHQGKMPQMHIVLNDVSSSGSVYGYGSYGEHEYFNHEKKSVINKLLNKNKGRS